MRKGTAFVVAATAIAGGYFVGRFTRQTVSESSGRVAQEVAGNEAAGGGVDRKRVPLVGHAKGPANALVNIVEWSDFQCPFCSRVEPTVDRVTREYQGKVRVFFRHYPLPFHQNAHPAAEAAEAAAAQGKFWEMHAKLFGNQQNLDRPGLEKLAQDIGLDMGKFKAALDGGTYKAKVDQDMAAGSAVGVNGTPAFYINGRELSGAQPFDAFKKIIDEEIASAQKLASKGLSGDALYNALLGSGGSAAQKPAAPPAPRPAQPNVGSEVFKVAVGSAPAKGGKKPKVTLVEFSDFQCPFCSRVNATLAELVKSYGEDVQIAFKHYPLVQMHPNALAAAQAAEAAHEQGKFWEMHDKLFANQQSLDRASFEKYAQELGLDMAKFKASLDGGKGKAAVDADMKQADTFGVRGTPTFFVNGRLFRGAQPLENFKSVIDEEIKKADAKLSGGTARGELYAAFIKDGKDKAEAPPAPTPQPGNAEAGSAYRVEVGKAPVKGAKDALVTIVQFSDFQCPFCSRVEPTIDRIMSEYKGKVRVAWKDLPLPFHPNAMPAAIAARAAGEQGKFWEMHDKLFANQSSLDRATFEKHAQELGLDMGRFKAALDGQKHKSDVEADAAQGSKFGVHGTPGFFINGVSLSGAQPFDAFKARIDEELKKAEALVAKGTPKAKVYDAILKGAKGELAAAPTPSGGGAAAEAGPEADTKVWEVKPGNSPAKGPKNAPVTLVLFSDFQCPFCGRVEPTITQLEKEYPGKVRVVWKNYPLPFHQNAKPAAKAALAAGEQGKFWEMHDKLFANQQSLDRASLEKYGQELGLDMSRFKAALDSPKFDAQIDAEMKEGQALDVNGTPASFINGRKIGGAYPYDTFKKIVDQELKKGPGQVAAMRRRRG